MKPKTIVVNTLEAVAFAEKLTQLKRKRRAEAQKQWKEGETLLADPSRTKVALRPEKDV